MLRALLQRSYGSDARVWHQLCDFLLQSQHPSRARIPTAQGREHPFCGKNGVSFIDADYDKDNWFARAKGMEWEPERGVRCTMRFDRTALYAYENGFPIMTSSLGISRWKNMAQIRARFAYGLIRPHPERRQ